MFADWIRWLSCLHPSELLLFLLPLLCLDVARYLAGTIVFWCVDAVRDAWQALFPRPDQGYEYCPSVCVVLAGLNEARTIGETLKSVWGTYPRLEIVVVDDGSTDGMAQIASDFAQAHSGVVVVRKPKRGGKSSALNCALPFTKADVLVCVDTDSHLGPNAIWEIVQPLSDPRVAAVSGAVILRNGFTNLCTWIQGLEYLRNIFLGRMTAARLGLLGIISGAFGAFRRTALERVGGWDVGPGEDGDLVLRLRKLGFRIEFNPYAQCCTNAPTNFWWLFKQRRRWEWATVTFECRKHVDLANPLHASFSVSNCLVLLERWFFSIILMYAAIPYTLWLCVSRCQHLPYIVLTDYVAYLLLEFAQLGFVLYYSLDRRRDAWFGLVLPLMPLYAIYLKAASLVAITEELFTRRSFRDNFVPPHVRAATWHW